MKPQRKDAGGGKTERLLSHPQTKAPHVHRAGGSAHQESEPTSSKGLARANPKSSSTLVCDESTISSTSKIKLSSPFFCCCFCLFLLLLLFLFCFVLFLWGGVFCLSFLSFFFFLFSKERKCGCYT